MNLHDKTRFGECKSTILFMKQLMLFFKKYVMIQLAHQPKVFVGASVG